MVRHIQTMCRQQQANCFSVFDHFMGLTLEGLKMNVAGVALVIDCFVRNWSLFFINTVFIFKLN